MKLTRWAFFISFISSTAFADDINIVGTLDYVLKSPSTSLRRAVASPMKQIKLLKLELSDTMQKAMSEHIDSAIESNEQFFNSPNLPNKVQLGMNNVPVLDQGRHGSCATFAVTAAVDAALNKGDYISQLCLLQLGNFLEPNSYIKSGWNGSFNSMILNEINIFGVINKSTQKEKGCGSLTEYPLLANQSPKQEMTPIDYHQLSESIKKTVDWTSVMTTYSVDEDKSLLAVKATLNAKDRLSFGVILVDLNLGVVGAVGQHNTANDTWIFTPEIKKDTIDFLNGYNPNFQLGGHAMVITGFDDDAIAVDDKGRQHKGLLTLRNSWGSTAGDNGNFYMSYEYFDTLSTEAERIRKVKSKA